MKPSALFTLFSLFEYVYSVKIRNTGKVCDVGSEKFLSNMKKAIKNGKFCLQAPGISMYEFSFNEQLKLSKLKFVLTNGEGINLVSVRVALNSVEKLNNDDVRDLFHGSLEEANTFWGKANQIYLHLNNREKLSEFLDQFGIDVLTESIVWQNSLVPHELIKSILLDRNKFLEILKASQAVTLAKIETEVNRVDRNESEQVEIARIRKVNEKLLTVKIVQELVNRRKRTNETVLGLLTIKRILKAYDLLKSDLTVEPDEFTVIAVPDELTQIVVPNQLTEITVPISQNQQILQDSSSNPANISGLASTIDPEISTINTTEVSLLSRIKSLPITAFALLISALAIAALSFWAYFRYQSKADKEAVSELGSI